MDQHLAKLIQDYAADYTKTHPKFTTDMELVANQLANLPQNKISVGKAPTYCLAHIEGNYIAVCESGSLTQTVAVDFNSETFAYFTRDDLRESADFMATDIANEIVKNDPSINYLGLECVTDFNGYATHPNTLVERIAKQLAEEYAKRLNMTLKSVRVNEYEVVTGENREAGVAPVFFSLSDGKGNDNIRCLVGFYSVVVPDKLYMLDLHSALRSSGVGDTSKSNRRKKVFRIVATVVVIIGVALFIFYKLKE